MGREFIDLFENWATSYDDSVSGHDPEYRAVFNKYDTILEEVANHSTGNVLEFGVGTGNLSQRLLDKGATVIGVEPSSAMRKQAATKFPHLMLENGDFLNFPKIDMPISTIASTYAFHHLTDEEKGKAVKQFSNLLTKGGKIVFADTVFESEQAKSDAIQHAEKKGFLNLSQDLQTEYYPTIETLQNLFESNGFYVTFKQMNDFVWLMVAEKTA
jgi:putative AdoMet-dependent methyltransferase